MRLTIVSDTHSHHEELGILEGDVLIHCGDACNGFVIDDEDVARLDDWFGRQQFERILCVGGNHDFAFENRERHGKQVLRHAEYLVDRPVEYCGIRFYGAPWLPTLTDWAYFARPDQLVERWSHIPEDTDVLITHTPPFEVLDRNRRGDHVGCPHLRDRVAAIRPRVHCFGHVHRGAGQLQKDDTLFVNAAMVDSAYSIAHRPIEVEL